MRTNTTLPSILLVFCTIHLLGQSGTLDMDFGENGIAIYDFASVNYAKDLAIQEDGKIVVVGGSREPVNFNEWHISMIRLNPDGSGDNTFLNNGILYEVAGEGSANSVAMQADGKIIIVGTIERQSTNNIVLIRLNPDGSYDTSFNSSGITYTNIEEYSTGGSSVFILPNGKILVAGTAYSTNDKGFAVFLYKQDGTLDNTFGTNGYGIIQFENYYSVKSAAIQTDGKIVLIGYFYDGTEYDFALARFTSDGYADLSFGTDGKLISDFGGNNLAEDVVIQDDQKIIIVGYSGWYYDEPSHIILARYSSEGSLDETFGANGIITTVVGYNIDAKTVVIQSDGKIVIAGSSRLEYESYKYFTLVRYNSDGSLDNSFGIEGISGNEIRGSILSSAIQADEKIIVVGANSTYSSDSPSSNTVARYLSGLNTGVIDFSKQSNTSLIYPNPIEETATLEYELIKNERLSAVLYDISGKIISTFFALENRKKGMHKEIINFSNIPSGKYILRLSNHSSSMSIKIIKL